MSRERSILQMWKVDSQPPSQLGIALLFQTQDGVSDEEAIELSAYDLRWKVAPVLGRGAVGFGAALRRGPDGSGS